MKVILGKASASSKNKKYPTGEIHAILMFVKLDDNKKAQRIAKIELEKRNWKKIKLSRIGAVKLENFNSEEPQIESAFTSAVETNFGYFIYPEIENDLNL